MGGKLSGGVTVGLVLLAVVGLFMVPTRPPSKPGAARGTAQPSPTRLPNETPVRLAYFPNVTHAPAVVGVARGTFREALTGQGILWPKVFNAGPEAMEALLARAIDVAYVGPGPAINTYVKTKGTAIRVVAGAASGGAALVARGDVDIQRLEDLANKRVAVPQLGGTQDIACRRFLADRGLKPIEQGGSVQVMPVKNPDILSLFKQKQLDAAWVPEPWASRLIHEAGAKLVIDERDLWPDKRFITTVIVTRTDFAEAHPQLLRALLRAHAETVAWLAAHPADGKRVLNEQLALLTGKPLPTKIIDDAWARVAFTTDPDRAGLEAVAQASDRLGYLKLGGVDLRPLVDQRFVEARTK